MTTTELTEAQLDGLACASCGRDAREAGPMVPSGTVDGRTVFECERCAAGDDGPGMIPLEDRRGLLMLLAHSPEQWGELKETMPDGVDLLAYAMHAIAAELLGLSVRYEDEVPTVKDIQVFLGGMVNGLLFGSEDTLAKDAPDDDIHRLQVIARDQGAAILAATGVTPVVSRS